MDSERPSGKIGENGKLASAAAENRVGKFSGTPESRASTSAELAAPGIEQGHDIALSKRARHLKEKILASRNAKHSPSVSAEPCVEKQPDEPAPAVRDQSFNPTSLSAGRASAEASTATLGSLKASLGGDAQLGPRQVRPTNFTLLPVNGDEIATGNYSDPEKSRKKEQILSRPTDAGKATSTKMTDTMSGAGQNQLEDSSLEALISAFSNGGATAVGPTASTTAAADDGAKMKQQSQGHQQQPQHAPPENTPRPASQTPQSLKSPQLQQQSPVHRRTQSTSSTAKPSTASSGTGQMEDKNGIGYGNSVGPQTKAPLSRTGSGNGLTLAAAAAVSSSTATAAKASDQTVAQNGTTTLTLENLLKVDKDLRLWLGITGYFDAAKRRAMLARYEKLKEFDEAAEKKRLALEAERAREEATRVRELAAIEEDRLRILREIEGTAQPGSLQNVTPSGPSAAAVAAATLAPLVPPGSSLGPGLLLPDPSSLPSGGLDSFQNLLLSGQTPQAPNPQFEKRARTPQEDQHAKKRKLPHRFGDRSPQPQPQFQEQYRDRHRSQSPRPYGHQQHDNRQVDKARYGQHQNHRFDKPAYDSYRDREPRPTPGHGDHYYQHQPRGPRRHDEYSPNRQPMAREHRTRVNFGRSGDTRFFMVKSFSGDNVRACMDDGLWTTQDKNGEILAESFAKYKNVILFFSVNNSKAIQGYARMITPPNANTPSPHWHKGLHWKTSDPFRVEWISRTETPFWRVGHLKNPLNENLQVFVAKDGQEFPFDLGMELVSVMDDVTNEAMGVAPITDKRFDDKNRYEQPESPRGRTRDFAMKRATTHRSRSRPGAHGPPRANTGFSQRGGWGIKREPHENSGTW